MKILGEIFDWFDLWMLAVLLEGMVQNGKWMRSIL